ncbi:hypothetical protein BIFDEN_00041 [Bifidobacterium dentium ATCC 27678]|nr:hypothetical protein BIFDEN_00041 [Bifidobacterium dentium ATCC 27678]
MFLARNEGVIISTRDDEYGDKPVKSGGSGCSPRGCKDDEKGIDSTPEPQGEGEEGLWKGPYHCIRYRLNEQVQRHLPAPLSDQSSR